MEYQHLRYKFELAVVGMRDGPASSSTRSPLIRLQVLLSYKKDWPRLDWTDEQKIRIPVTATQVSVSGDFLYYVGGQSLDLVELPSCRTNRPPSQTRHLRYNTSQSDGVAIDTLQSLIVASQTYRCIYITFPIAFKLTNSIYLVVQVVKLGFASRFVIYGTLTSTPELHLLTMTAPLMLLNQSRRSL